MEDMREDGGYRMANRFTGLDFDHCELVVSELARYHALGYAYKKTLSSEEELFTKFPFLRESMMSRENEKSIRGIYDSTLDSCVKILSRAYAPDSPEFKKLKGLAQGAYNITAHFVAGSNDLSLDKMLLTPVDLEDVNLRDRERKKRNQWLVLTHGDSWVNNFLFKYSGERPSGVKLIDLQVVREACLTTDLAYFLYMSTTAELRKKHLNRLLSIYFNTFQNVCESLSVVPWPDFTFDNLRARYGKAVAFGASTALNFLPIILLPKDSAVDLEQEATHDNFFGSVFTKGVEEDGNLQKRMVALAEEILASNLFDNSK